MALSFSVCSILRLALGLAVAAAVFGSPSQANAADGCMTTLGAPRRFQGPALHARLARAERAVDQSARRSALWAGIWGTAFAGAAAGSLSVAATTDNTSLATDLYVSGASATFGALLRVVMFPKPVLERRALRRKSLTDPCERLQNAEQALARSARWEGRGRRPFIHFASLGYSASVALIHGLVLKRPYAANRQFAIGAVIGQVFLLSTPRHATRELLALSGDSERFVLTQVRPFRLHGGGGIQAGGRF